MEHTINNQKIYIPENETLFALSIYLILTKYNKSKKIKNKNGLTKQTIINKASYAWTPIYNERCNYYGIKNKLTKKQKSDIFDFMKILFCEYRNKTNKYPKYSISFTL